MRPRSHCLISLLLALITLYLSNSWVTALCLFLTGFLIDLDHLLDFWLLAGFKIKDIEVDDTFYAVHNRIYIIFHSFELIPLFLLFAYLLPGPIIVGTFLGYSSHLLSDIVGNYYLNSVKPELYFFSYRAYRQFNYSLLHPESYKEKLKRLD